MKSIQKLPPYVLAALMLFLSALDSGATLIEIREQAAVSSDIVRLADVAAVTDAPSNATLEAMKGATVCAAPPPAETQMVRAADIAAAIAEAGIDTATVKWGGSHEVLVTREYELMPAEELIDAFRQKVIEQTGWGPESFSIQPPKNLSPLPVPTGKRALQISIPPGTQLPGNVVAGFEILCDNTRYRTLSHRFVVDQFVNGLVALSKFRRGQPAEEGRFELAKVEKSRLSGNPVTDPEQLEGKRATRTIFPGSPIDTDSFAAPPLIKRGATAPAVWSGSGFSIVMKGQALDEGSMNEIVRVRLPSKKVVRAKVIDSGILKITE